MYVENECKARKVSLFNKKITGLLRRNPVVNGIFQTQRLNLTLYYKPNALFNFSTLDGNANASFTW